MRPSGEKELKDLKNVGKAVLADFEVLGVSTVDDLAECDPTELFYALERNTGKRHDPCMWDVFAATIHEARTGEATVWWKWTAQRKELQKSGKLSHAVES